MTKPDHFSAGLPRFVLIFEICFSILLSVIHLIGQMTWDISVFVALGIILAHLVYLRHVLKHASTVDQALLQVVIVFMLLGLGYGSHPVDDSLRVTIIVIGFSQLTFLFSLLAHKKKAKKTGSGSWKGRKCLNIL